MKQRCVVKSDAWPIALRSVRKLHSKVAGRGYRLNLWGTRYASVKESDQHRSLIESSNIDSQSSSRSFYDDSGSEIDFPDDIATNADEGSGVLEQNCKICQLPRGRGYFTMKMIRQSASTGRQCCATILDAIVIGTENSKLYNDFGQSLELKLEHASICLTPDYNLMLNGITFRKTSSAIWIDWSTTSGHEHAPKGTTLLLLKPKGATLSGGDIASIYEFPVRSLIAFDTSSKSSFCQIVEWLEDCTRNHSMCQKGSSQTMKVHNPSSAQIHMPKRVLEISGHQLVLRESLTSSRPYACLSHCWGPTGVSFQLNTSTLRTLTRGISISALPKTFRDAVLVCVRLGITFIWIDALCIVQDSVDDWKEAAATMASIYMNGLVTIAATASTDSNTGCFTSTKSPSWPKKLSNSCLHVMQDTRASWHEKKFDYCPLLRRAWVFQERLLSPRVIHFAECQLIWECNSSWKSQSGDINIDWSNGDSYRVVRRKLREDPFKYAQSDPILNWSWILEDYTKLDITYSEDRLPALAAVVEQAMLYHPEDVYIAGLWKNSMIRGLLWHCTGPPHSICVQRPTSDIPTWSWASVAEPITTTSCEMVLASRISYISIEESGPPDLGNPHGAAVTVRAHCCRVALKDNDHGPGPLIVEITQENVPKMFIELLEFHSSQDYKFHTGPRPIDEGEKDFAVFLVRTRGLSICHWEGLLLREVKANEYERKGWFDMRFSFSRDPFKRHKASPGENWQFRALQSLVLSFPVREFRII